MIRSLPNLLSLARLAIAPYLFWLLWRGHFNAALAAIVVVLLTLAGLLYGISVVAPNAFAWLGRL